MRGRRGAEAEPPQAKRCEHGLTGFCKQCAAGAPASETASASAIFAAREARLAGQPPPAEPKPAPARAETEQARMTRAERAEYIELKTAARLDHKAFLRFGLTLLRIRDGRLYREEYGSFEAFCDREFGISRSRGYRLIQAAEVASQLVGASPIGDIRKERQRDERQAAALTRSIVNEAQARELAPLKGDPAAMAAAVEEAAEGGQRPTAARIRQAVRRRTAPDPEPEVDEPPAAALEPLCLTLAEEGALRAALAAGQVETAAEVIRAVLLRR